MTTETEQLTDLLRELVLSFIDHGESLSLDVREHPGAIYWRMKGHSDDHGKLVGKRGAHVDALTFLVKALGRANDALFVFALLEPEAGPRRGVFLPKVAETFDPGPACDLLCRILAELALGEFYVTSSLGQPGLLPLSFVFEIAVRAAEDYDALTVAPVDGSDLTIIGTLRTLFRAAANKAGVKFSIAVEFSNRSEPRP